MGMNELSETINNDNEYFEKAVKRVASMTHHTVTEREIIIELEKEINILREKITSYEDHVDTMNDIISDLKKRCESKPTTLEAVQQSTTAEIIKALSENGYTNISINFYKDIEKERETDA